MAVAGSLPRYVQLSEMVIREIASGRLMKGDRLPPEREMAAAHDVSVGTLRKALADLEAKGLLERRQGSGNYIKENAKGIGIYAFLRLESVDGVGVPTARTINVFRRTKPEGAPDFGPAPDGHRIRRVRYLSGRPVAVEEIWIDGGLVDVVQLHELSESLHLFYRDTLKTVISRVEDRIATAPVPDWADSAIGPKPGDIVGYVERIGWDQRGERVEYSRTWFDGDRARYVSRLGQGMTW